MKNEIQFYFKENFYSKQKQKQQPKAFHRELNIKEKPKWAHHYYFH